jgi:hypothetical protein
MSLPVVAAVKTQTLHLNLRNLRMIPVAAARKRRN